MEGLGVRECASVEMCACVICVFFVCVCVCMGEHE